MIPQNFLEVERRVESAISAIRSGKMVIMVDDESRENEGDLVFAAQFATPELINFMATHARGLICLSMDDALIRKLELPMMTDANQAQHQTAFTVSIEARHGVTTGISAHDRAHTVQCAIKDGASRNDIVVPGHIFPLRAQPGGVLVRTGHTEGSVDLSRLAGLKEAAVICEVLNADGSMARRGDLEKMSQQYALPVVSIEDLVLYRRMKDASLVIEIERRPFENRFGVPMEMRIFESTIDRVEHVALVLGNEQDFLSRPALVRVHAENPSVDLFQNLQKAGPSALEISVQKIAEFGLGVFLYVRQDLKHHLSAQAANDKKIAVHSGSDIRHFGIGAQILRSIGVKDMMLLSDTDKKMVGLQGFGLQVLKRVPLHNGVVNK